MICLYDKHVGETMNEVIKRFSQENNIKEKIAYAGRLDPLAYGKIIILTGNDIYKKDDYCNKSKIYETWMIDGVVTDTYDIMGLICHAPLTPTDPAPLTGPNTTTTTNTLTTTNTTTTTNTCPAPLTPTDPAATNINIGGSYRQYYPPYSSIPIRIGNTRKPLWYYTKNNIVISEELRPYKQVTLYNATKLDEKYISSNELLDIILDRISKVVTGDFRQEEICKQWKQYLCSTYCNNKYKISKWRFEISSGGYIRYIANMMGSTSYDIHRIAYKQV